MLVHTDAAKGLPGLPSPAEVRGFFLLLSAHWSEVVVASPGGKGKPIGAWPAKGQDLLPSAPSKALAHEDSCGVWVSSGC